MSRWSVLLLAFAGVAVGVAPHVGATPPDAQSDSLAADQPGQGVRGVVWTPPHHPGPALRELARIAATGATAVRLTRLPTADPLFARADSLGLQLFVDLPVAYPSAATLRDSLRAAEPVLRRVQRRAARHESVYAVGLARGADTSRPQACAALRDWTTRVHDGSSSLHTYYVTPFAPSADRCADAVDLPLLDLRAHPAPVTRLRSWREHTPNTGIGALGTWVAPTAGSGLNVPHSAERQARHLETALTQLREQAPTAPVFVYRWRDAPSPLTTRQYGLRDSTGRPRLAQQVLAGLYRDTHRVFAFSAGTSPASSPHGYILLGWGVVLLLGGLYAYNPFVRRTLARYFGARGFYRDAVKEGRDVGPAENTILLAIVAGALGLTGALSARIAASQPVTERIVEALPAALQGLLGTGLTMPLLTGLVVGSLTLILLTGWALLLVLTAPASVSFSPAQGLMLVVWPCWPAIAGVGVILVAATDPPLPPGLLALSLTIGAIGATAHVTIQVLRDFWLVTRLPLPWIGLLALPSPLVVTGLGAGLLAAQYDLPLWLLWHLLTRT
jgi:hypothetical protein